MQSVKLKSCSNSDGVLHLDIPVGLANQELEVVVVFQTVERLSKAADPVSRGWPPGFFERTAGCIQDDSFIRYPQGEFDEREMLD